MHKGQKTSEATKRKLSEALEGHVVSEETRKKISKSLTGSKLSEETKKKIAIANKGKQNCLGHYPSIETRRKMSESHKNHINPSKLPEVRAKISAANKGPKNGMWKGGYHRQKYCYRFNDELKNEIRKEHEYKCFLCPTIQEKPGLCIHHIDYNHNAGCKNMRFALLPLCFRCHNRTNSNRWYWFNLLICYWANLNEFASMAGF